MKKFLSLIIPLVLLNFYAISQISINIKVKTDTIKVKKYRHVYGKQKQIFLKMNYGSFNIFNKNQINEIKGKHIEKIQLIYTTYPKDNNVKILNKKRLISLYLLEPQLFNNAKIKWKFIEQTGANSKNVYNYFHGFIITYSHSSIYSNAKEQKKHFKNIIQGKALITDSTVLKVFERNKWNDMLIVADMTSSMYPYIGELLLWYHLNIKKQNKSAFVFFNDGDLKPDSIKILGKTGGIYHTNVNNIDVVLNKIYETMKNGIGGSDIPENDIEAILFGIKKYHRKKNIVLIADNRARMRDYRLMKKLNKPIKIILCGVKEKINPEYLDLAYKTNGTIHTIEKDILDLIKYKEGETIKIGKETFLIKNGKFVLQKEKK